MALIVEDGTGRTDAVSLVSLPEADAYHAQRGNAAWAAATEAERETALVRATDHVSALRYRGVRKEQDQALAWPRTGVAHEDGFPLAADVVPIGVRLAVCEAALREVLTPGSLAPDDVDAGRIRKEKVDVLETEYFENAPVRPRFPAVERLLRPYLATGISTPLERA